MYVTFLSFSLLNKRKILTLWRKLFATEKNYISLTAYNNLPNLADESGLKDLLSFCTAVPSIPPMGFDNPSVVTVTSICSYPMQIPVQWNWNFLLKFFLLRNSAHRWTWQLALSQLDLGLFRQQETKTQPMRTFALWVTVNALTRMPCFFLSYGTRVNLKCLMTNYSCCLISSGCFAC